jgi:hypothetical protein
MSTLDRSYPGLHRLPLSGSVRDLPDPPAALTPDTFAARLYAMLAPLAQQDPTAGGWSLLILHNAIGTMYQLVEDWVRDTPDGPGWSLLMDAERCPPEALPWLGQFAGVRIPAGVTDDAERRAWVESTDGFNRGTRDALIGAAKATLTGAQRLIFRERDGAAYGAGSPDYAYYLTVYSYATETPNPTATLNALLAQKPGGIVLHYQAATMQDYQNVKDTNATYAVVHSTFKDYAALAMNQPG